MPPGIERLLEQGVLGVIVLFGMWVIVQSARAMWSWGFSRDKESPGLITQYGQMKIAREQKMGIFLDTVTDREIKQQELCQRHNDGLMQIGQTLASRASVSEQVIHESCQLVRAVACRQWPDSAADVEKHCAEIERIANQVR